MFEEFANDEITSTKKLTHRFACYVYNHETKKIQIAEFGWSVVKAIGELSKSSQYKYKGLPPFDIIIKKTGSGMQTEYTVTPGRNEDKLSEEVMKDLKEKESIHIWLDKRKEEQEGNAIETTPTKTSEQRDQETQDELDSDAKRIEKEALEVFG